MTRMTYREWKRTFDIFLGALLIVMAVGLVVVVVVVAT